MLVLVASPGVVGAQPSNAGCPGVPNTGSCSLSVTVSGGSLPGQSIQASLFTPNSTVTFEIFESVGGPLKFGPESRQTGQEGNAGLVYNLLEPGNEVIATDVASSIVKRAVVVPLTVGTVDTVTDTASGTAPPGAQVHVTAHGPPGAPAEADQAGVWVKDFAAEGVDITVSTSVTAHIFDADGDVVRAFIEPGCPPVGGTCSMRVDITNDAIFAQAFTPDSPLTLEIFDPAGSLVFGPVTGRTDVGGNGGHFGRPEFDLTGGYRVVITDVATSFVKELILSELVITSIDTNNDIVSGTANPGDHVFVSLNVNQDPEDPGDYFADVVADEAGSWTIDFGARGADIPDELPQQSAVGAQVTDDDGDSTTAILPPGCPRLGDAWGCLITASIEHDSIGALGFTPNSDVTIEVFDRPNGTLIFGPLTRRTDRFGDGHTAFPIGLGPDLVPGNYIKATDHASGTVKDLVIVELFMDLVDVETDVVAGRAPPGTRVSLAQGLFPVADSNGEWTADFRRIGVDITDEDFFFATVFEDDGDVTVDVLGAPIPGCVSDGNTVCGSAGPDTLRTTRGKVVAGLGEDVVLITVNNSTEEVEIDGGLGSDGVAISPASQSALEDPASVMFSGGGGSDRVILPAHAGDLEVIVSGGRGDDRVTTRNFGGSGVSVGLFVVNGGGGDDSLFAGDAADRLDGGAGDDSVDGGKGNDRLGGGDGSDVLHGAGGANDFSGGSGVDTCLSDTDRDRFKSCERIRRNHRRNHQQA